MTYSRILVDTNICIDAAIVRKPFADTALKIINLSDSGEIEVKISAHSLGTIFYVLRKEFSISKRYALIEELRSVFGVAPVTQRIIDRALKLRWKDFEDAIHYHAALASDCDAIVTRNRSDFQESELPVLSPIQFLEAHVSEKNKNPAVFHSRVQNLLLQISGQLWLIFVPSTSKNSASHF